MPWLRRGWLAFRSLLAVALCIVCRHALADAGAGDGGPGGGLPPAPQLPLQLLRLPPGFRAQIYVNATVSRARMMALGQNNGSSTVVYVSSTGSAVTAVVARQAQATTACQLITNLGDPNGIAYL